MEQIQTDVPINCRLWNEPLSEDLISDLLTTVHIYTNDYRLTRCAKKCKCCNQIYFYEFYEFSDFASGDDNQYTCYIPVADLENANQLNSLSRMALTGFLSIRINFPPRSAPYWHNRG